jgi:REP element-mobilizing transposase RayT
MKNRKPNRIPGYDYSCPGAYFVTICVQNRIPAFGAIKNDEMCLNNCGEILKKQWFWLGEQYRYITLDEFIVMPDHIHGIVIIKESNLNDKIKPLHEIIGVLKTTSSKHIHLAGNIEFKWQRSFYDRIVRTEEDLNIIRNYIRCNPMRRDTHVGETENRIY